MPMKSRTSDEEAAAAPSGEDRLSVLPDDALLHVLSLLPSEDAVRTCVLAQRWRHLWRSVPALRVARDGSQWWSVRKLNSFVTQFLARRDGRSPLRECDIGCFPFGIGLDDASDDDLFRFAKRWIRRSVSRCQARVLKVSVYTNERRLELTTMRLVSRHLTTVDLYQVELDDPTLDLSSCPALEDLEMNSCSIAGGKIILPSVKCLRIIGCDFYIIPRARVSAPNVVSLMLSESGGFTPLFESMPSLATAFVRFDDGCDEKCSRSYFGDCGDGRCDGCYGNLYFEDDEDDQCVLLEGLSAATKLELIAPPEVFVCRKDLKLCPTFSKLKTLLLNEWCVAADFSTLIYFLQHSPILEKLSLQLDKVPEPVIEANGRYNPREGSLVSKNLKLVEIKCRKDEMVHKLLSLLNACGVPSDKIAIQEMSSCCSEKFSFEQKKTDTVEVPSTF
ncbi:hypothetical protein EJB05_36991, partial [Eragrostis curvula]